MAELERVLRRYDLDASELPDRLRFLLDPVPGTPNPNDLSHLVTTDSFDLPCPAVLPTRDMILGPDGQRDTRAAVLTAS